jgi:hypothetical protein
MDASQDTLTLVVTGHLPGILIAAAVLTWPFSWLLLGLYRRAVSRSMAQRASAHATTGTTTPPAPPPIAPVGVAALDVSTAISDTPDSQALLRHLTGRPWHAARVYALAALAYAVVLTVVTAPFAEPGAPFRPVRFLLLTTMFAWPVVLTLAMVAGSVRQRKRAIAGIYTLAYLAIVVIATLASPEFSVWQGILLWALYNGPSTALVALCLSRRIRAVGPMVLLFLILGLLGSDALLAIVGSTDVLLRGAVTAGGWFGLGGVGTFFAMILIGFAAFAVIGAGLLAFIRRRYEAKRLSDESLTIDTVWWLFVFGHAVGLAFEHPLAPLGGIVAMAAFKIGTRVGFARRTDVGSARKLLLLRSFSIGARSERLFDTLEKHWRRVGSIQMIAGADLATRTVEPHEFLDFVTGRLARRFIDRPATLDRRLREMDLLPDRDGRYRVNDFFCYDDTCTVRHVSCERFFLLRRHVAHGTVLVGASERRRADGSQGVLAAECGVRLRDRGVVPARAARSRAVHRGSRDGLSVSRPDIRPRRGARLRRISAGCRVAGATATVHVHTSRHAGAGAPAARARGGCRITCDASACGVLIVPSSHPRPRLPQTGRRAASPGGRRVEQRRWLGCVRDERGDVRVVVRSR